MSSTTSPRLDTPLANSPSAGRQLAAVKDAPATLESAVARLALSRANLRTAMLPTPRTAGTSGILGDGVGGLAEKLVERLRSLPGAGAILETIQSWWDQHPLRPAGRIAASTARRLAGPFAERSPLKLVFAALAFGALLAIVRPWRWMLRSAIFAGLVPALAMRAVRELPIDTLFDAFSSTFGGASKSSSSSAERSHAQRSDAGSNPGAGYSAGSASAARSGSMRNPELARTADTMLP